MRVWNIPGPDQDWFTKAEVCLALDVGERTLDRLIADGYFPPGFRSARGGRLRWTGLDVAAYLHLIGRGAKKGAENAPTESGEEATES